MSIFRNFRTTRSNNILPNPAFVVIEIAGEHANQIEIVANLASIARGQGGAVYAYAPSGQVACLEPGSLGASLVLVSWDTRDQARRVVSNCLVPHLATVLPIGATLTILLADGLPTEGLTGMLEVPTIASIPRPPADPRNAFLLVRGSAWDQERLNQYRDVIFTMHKERGGYYESLAVQPGQVEPLIGVWREQIFAISRWPCRAAAEDFWFSREYQTRAIPLRLGSGRFSVHLVEAPDSTVTNP